MAKQLRRGLLVLTAFFMLELYASAQLPFLRLDQATVDTGSSTVELMVTNPQDEDVTVSNYHLTVVKEKVFLRRLQLDRRDFVSNALMTDVVGHFDVFRRGFLTSAAPTLTELSLLRVTPADRITRNPLLPVVVKDVTASSRVCYPCGNVLTGLTRTFTGDADENALWRNIDALQRSHHNHTAVNQNVVTNVTTTQANAVDIIGVVKIPVFNRLMFDRPVYDITQEREPIVYECPLIYDQPQTVVAPGESATITISMRDIAVGDPACIPRSGDRVIIHAYNDVGAWVLQAMKTAP